MARLRILAGQMRGALGSGNVAVRTVYVSPRVLGAASPAAASSAEVTWRALLSERSSAKYRANTKSKRFCSSHTRACLGVKGTRSSAPHGAGTTTGQPAGAETPVLRDPSKMGRSGGPRIGKIAPY